MGFEMVKSLLIGLVFAIGWTIIDVMALGMAQGHHHFFTVLLAASGGALAGIRHEQCGASCPGAAG